MEVKELMEKLNKEWTEFKSDNDKRLAEIAAKGSADPLTEAKVDKHSIALGELQKQVETMTAKLNRPGVSPEDESKVETKEYKKLFQGFMRKGDQPERLTDLQTKLMQVGVDTDGGVLVPEELDRSIGVLERDASPLEGIVTSITAGAESYERLFDLKGTGSGWVGETDARPETTSPTFGSFRPSYGELYAFPFATQKMLDDSFLDIEAWLAAGVAEKFGEDLDVAIMLGNGVTKPRGMLAYPLATTADATRAYGTVQQVNSGTSGDFTADNLIDLIHQLKPGYRGNAQWLMPTLTVAKVRKFKTTGLEYIWQPGLQAGQPSSLFGFSIVEDENVPAVAAAAKAVLFGDFRRAYKLVNIRGVRVLRDPFTAKPKVGFYTTKRVGGGVEDTAAFKVLSLEA